MLVASLFLSCNSQASFRLSRINSYDSTEIFSGYFVYDYDSSDNRTKYSIYSTPDTLMQYHTFEYSSGQLQKMTQYDGSDTLLYYRLFIYDVQKRIIRADIYDTSNTLSAYLLYEYNTGNNLEQISLYSAGNALGSYSIYEYNGSQLYKRSSYNDSDVLQYYSLYTYGANERIRREDLYDSGDSLTGYNIYEYEEGVSTYESYFGQSSW